MAQPFPRPRLSNNVIVLPGLKSFPRRVYAHPLSRDLRPQLVRIRPPLAQGTPPVIDPTNPAFGQIIKLSKAAPLWATQPPSLHFPGTAFAPEITLVRI